GVARRGEETLGVPLVDQLRVLEENRIRDAELVRVQRTVRILPEHVTAQAGEERIHVVRVPTGALRHRDRDVSGRLPLVREGFPLELRKRLRKLHEARVYDKPDVLELRR